MKQNEAFCKIPKSLFQDVRYIGLSNDSKILYVFLLDRMSLSEKNGWRDKEGKTYIYFTQEEAKKLLNVGKDKCIRLYSELEAVGLIMRKKQGLGKPCIIYIKDFSCAEKKSREVVKRAPSEEGKTRSENLAREEANNNKINNINKNNTDLTTERGELREKIKKQIKYTYLELLFDRRSVDPIVEIMEEVMSRRDKEYLINGERKSGEDVASKLSQLNSSDVEYSIEVIKKASEVKNFRGYILSTLYNSKLRITRNANASTKRPRWSSYAARGDRFAYTTEGETESAWSL